VATQEDIIKERLYKQFQLKYFSTRNDGKTEFMQLNPKEKREFCALQRVDVEEGYEKIIYCLIAIAKRIGQNVADEFYKLFISGKDLRKLPVNNNQKTAYFDILKKFGLENVINESLK